MQLNAWLATRAFLVGTRITLADLLVFATVYRALVSGANCSWCRHVCTWGSSAECNEYCKLWGAPSCRWSLCALSKRNSCKFGMGEPGSYSSKSGVQGQPSQVSVWQAALLSHQSIIGASCLRWARSVSS